MSIKDGLFESPEGESNEHKYHSAAEKALHQLVVPFDKFISCQMASSCLVIGAVVVALLLANYTGTQGFYKQLTTTKLGILINSALFSTDIKFLVNDILLSLFFLILGLEIKKELIIGELSNYKKSMLILVAAFSGAIFPALSYIGINYSDGNLSGFGVPIATDTAIAIGILSFFARYLNRGVFTFIVALAIIDDILAVLVIAVFYNNGIDAVYLSYALGLASGMLLLNYLGLRKFSVYFFLGCWLWYFIEHAGLHGTIAGIMTAFTIPARPRLGPNSFARRVKSLLKKFEKRKEEKSLILEDEEQHKIVEKIESAAVQATTPVQRVGSTLEPSIMLLILPVFALLNAGVTMTNVSFEQLIYSPVMQGIFLGLVIGKPLGVILSCWVLKKWTSLELPDDLTMNDVVSVAFFCGIGFTMSIFIADINFTQVEILTRVKLTVLLASTLSCCIGISSIIFQIWQKGRNYTRST